MSKSGVYQIINKNSQKRYVGASLDIEARWETHKSLLRNGKHHTPYLQNSWDLHGPDTFKFEIVEENEHPFKGGSHTDEARERMSKAARAWHAENDHPFEGQEHTEESKRKMSRSLKAHYAENDVWNKGISPSEETRRKISAALRGRSLSEEHKAQLSKVSSGENNPDAKLTEERVREIHRFWNTGEYSQSEIGRKFNVTQANVSSIVNGKTWFSVYEEFSASDAAE